MGIGKYITRRTFPEGNFQQIRANAPSQRNYNIRATEDLVRNLPGGLARDVFAPAAAGIISIPYDAIQAATRVTENDINRAMGTAGMSGLKDMMAEAYGLAYGRENPLSSAYERMVGASAPLANRINNFNIGSAQASIPTNQEDRIKSAIQKQMIKEGTATPMARRKYGNMSMGQGRPDWVADRSPVQQGLKEIEIAMAPFVANRIPGQQDLASDFFMDSITKDSKFYDPYKPTFRDRIKQGLTKGYSKYAKPVIGGIMSAVSGIPGMGLLMNMFNQPDPYAQNRIDMYGAYRDPNTGFMKDKFGYNVGKTLMKNRFMEPGSNSYRSYALDAMRGMDRAGKRPALDNYYQQTYGKTWDQVKKDHQQKKDPFNNTNPFSGTADNFAGGADKSFDTGQPSTAGVKGSSYSRGNYGGRGHHWAKGGIVSLWRR